MPEPVRVINDIGDLTEILGAALRGTDIYAIGPRLNAPLLVQGVDLDELVFEKPGSSCALRFSYCRIRHLRVLDAIFLEGASFEDCTIEVLDARSWRRGRLGVLRCRVDELRVHALPEVTVAHSVIRAGVTLSNIAARVDLNNVRCGGLLIDDDQTGGGLLIDLQDIEVSGALQIRDVRAVELRLANCDAEELRIGRARAAAVTVEDCRFRGPVRVHIVAGADGATLRLATRAEGDVELQATWSGVPTRAQDSEHKPEETWALVVDAARLVACDDVQIVGPVRLDLQATRINGRLRLARGPGGSGRCVLDADSTVAAVAVGPQPIRTSADACRAAETLFGAAGSIELSLLHRALADRPDDQDSAYFALRVAETRARGGWPRLAGVMRGAVLGWGVRLLQPLRALAVGVVGTAVGLHVSGASRAADETLIAIRPVVRALVLAAGLWFNVGVGLPSEQRGAAWSAAAVGFTISGIVLVTVTVGVAIRRLVR